MELDLKSAYLALEEHILHLHLLSEMLADGECDGSNSSRKKLKRDTRAYLVFQITDEARALHKTFHARLRAATRAERPKATPRPEPKPALQLLRFDDNKSA